MSTTETIIRIAAKGDGVTASGRHVPGTVTGDQLASDGSIERGPHHVDPPCRHFPQCGGCQLQHADEEALQQFVTARVVDAAAGQGVTSAEVLPAHLSPPRSRRRATLHAANAGGGVVIGFREEGSHRIVAMKECHILRPELFDLVAPLKAMLARRKGKLAADISLTLIDQGVDCSIKGLSMDGLSETEAMLDFARDNGLARLTVDLGYGPEAVWEPEPVTVSLSGVPVGFPSGGFLQATQDGEDTLVDCARQWLPSDGIIADLFSGLGTFAFALADGRKVLAAEAAQDAFLACKSAAGRSGNRVVPVHRDLFRNPLMPEELDRFSGVLLDPPRAGAREQITRIAESAVGSVVYVSCNPASWARDAARLVEGGYRLERVKPVGQFRWSTHVELASLFVK